MATLTSARVLTATDLDDRAAYETVWASWLKDGWRVVSCTSGDRLVPDGPRGVPARTAADYAITSV